MKDRSWFVYKSKITATTKLQKFLKIQKNKKNYQVSLTPRTQWYFISTKLLAFKTAIRDLVVRLCLNQLLSFRALIIQSFGSKYKEIRMSEEISNFKLHYTSSANFIRMVVRGRCCPSTGTKWAVTTAGNPAPSRTPLQEKKKILWALNHTLLMWQS